MDIVITGYQWGDDNKYIGIYNFPNNLDREDIHLPPNTTLISPPKEVPNDSYIYWDGTNWGTKELANIKILSNEEMLRKIESDNESLKASILVQQKDLEAQLLDTEKQYQEAQKLAEEAIANRAIS